MTKKSIVVVSHADLIKLILAHYLGVHIDLFQRIVIAPASLSVLALPGDGRVHILRVNDNGPLTIPAPAEAEETAESEIRAAADEEDF
jgi:broad specificity phosphatase PhoE